MEVIEKKQDGICILTLSGRLDASSSSEFREKIFKIIEDGTNRVILDCENLNYISSAGLRVVLEATKEIKQSNGKIMLCALQDYIKEVFEVAQFEAFLPIGDTLEEAIKTI
ncbi:MAG: STAS domain-containing protein [Syntrophobacterales bacterium]|jgi:anti-sigma B factor antagonist